jgi:hypothetical protein
VERHNFTTEQLASIDPKTLVETASLTAMLSHALRDGVSVGKAIRNEELRRAIEAKAVEKKKKRDEREKTGEISPRSLEKQRRNERNAITEERLEM